ncbi:hypothetical protein [Halorubrum lipolyticum]|uniref:Uncharacterized protein n=1 Tax=Halorubrum lipolyticum DSM 21995 TaxID=1227482 RepID=M0P4H7_9EURY|nr:hypothetical protein [Halorubrum lipolyticum]EMA64718.1 hypothetical protein C469_00640 [Halorubrum lipolyticum DSM 21995]
MTRERHAGAWSFPTARGSVRVAPGELRIRRGVLRTVAEAGRSLAAGRLPSALRDVGWTGILAVTAIAPSAVEWLLAGGGSAQTAFGVLGLLTAVSGVAVSVARERTATVPHRDIEHVAFDDGELRIVHRNGEGDDERETETVRPLDDAARADAALALRLRGVDLRGVEDDDAVSRTVVDAPKTELIA